MSEEYTANNMLVKIADAVFNLRPPNLNLSTISKGLLLKPLTFIHSCFLLSVQAQEFPPRPF